MGCTFHRQVRSHCRLNSPVGLRLVRWIAVVGEATMLQFPAFMTQLPSPLLIPTSTLLPVSAHLPNDEETLSLMEADLEDKDQCKDFENTTTQWSEVRKTNINLPVIGKKIADSKEEIDAGAEDDDVDNVGESEGDEFEQETG